MRVFIIADTHLGMRSSSVEWLDMVVDWFRQDFIPKARALARPGDILIHCGDVFDNRQSINLLVQHHAIGIIEELSKIFSGVYLLAGNHDVMRKNSNEISSLDCLKYIPGVTIFKEPKVIPIGTKKALMMPWMPSIDEERKCIEEMGEGASYLFCHTNIAQMKMDRVQRVEHGLGPEELGQFDRVFSGHIHIRQDRNNAIMVGNPYQMTRSDSGNDKGWYTLDPDTCEIDFYQNLHSPEFKKVYIFEYTDRPIDDLISTCKGHIVDLYIPASYVINGYTVNRVIDEVNSVAKSMEMVVQDHEGVIDVQAHDSAFDLLSLTDDYVSKMNGLDQRLKERVSTKVKELYKTASKE